MSAAVIVEDLEKTFVLHAQGGARLAVLRGVSLAVHAGECVAIAEPSGAGKSTLLRAIYGNYRSDGGRILVRHAAGVVDVATAAPREVLALRRTTIAHVSQFLRVIPRVPTLDVVAEPLRALGVERDEARDRSRALLARLRIPERLWSLSPVTFSGGEQQRVNIARGLIAAHPVLLLDEPTASLDATSRADVVGLVQDARARGAAVLGTFHDGDVRAAVADRVVRLHETAA